MWDSRFVPHKSGRWPPGLTHCSGAVSVQLPVINLHLLGSFLALSVMGLHAQSQHDWWENPSRAQQKLGRFRKTLDNTDASENYALPVHIIHPRCYIDSPLLWCVWYIESRSSKTLLWASLNYWSRPKCQLNNWTVFRNKVLLPQTLSQDHKSFLLCHWWTESVNA